MPALGSHAPVVAPEVPDVPVMEVALLIASFLPRRSRGEEEAAAELLGTRNCLIVFHSPHALHLPIHLMWFAPQLSQKKVSLDVGLALTAA